MKELKQKNFYNKAKELPQKQTKKYNLLCLTSSFNNQGLNYFAPKDEFTVIKDVISLPSNGNVYRAYFQSNEFTVLSDAYAIRWNNNEKILSEQYLFMVTSVNEVMDLPI